MFQTVVEYALSFLSKLREKETLKASLWKYLKKFSIKKFYQTMVFRVQFSTLVAIELKHRGNVIVTGRWQTQKKKRYAFVLAAAEKITLFRNRKKKPRTFPKQLVEGELILTRTESCVSISANCLTYLRGPCDKITSRDWQSFTHSIEYKFLSIISDKIFVDNLIDFSYIVCWDRNFSPLAKLRRTA